MDDAQVMRALALDESYHVVRVLADGPSGRTELVTLEDGDDTLLVRKRIPKALSNARAWASVVGVDDPLVPNVENMYRMPDALVVVYDYVEGESLYDLVLREGSLEAEKAVGVLCDVCHAAGVLHGVGVVHRDITPGNVICASDGAHLVDLGIARVGEGQHAHDTTTLGTWGFIAPEQLGYAQTDARSDVFSLGCLLGYMLTGFMPDKAGYEIMLMDETLIPAPLREVVRRACALEPSARYQSAGELAEAACDALAGKVRAASQAKQAERVPMPGEDGTNAPHQGSPTFGEAGQEAARPANGTTSQAGWPQTFSLGEEAPSRANEGRASGRTFPEGDVDALFSLEPDEHVPGEGQGADQRSSWESSQGTIVEATGSWDAGGEATSYGKAQPPSPDGYSHSWQASHMPDWQGADVSADASPRPDTWANVREEGSSALRSWAELPALSITMDVVTWLATAFAVIIFAVNTGGRQGVALILYLAMNAWAIVWTVYCAIAQHRRTMKERTYRLARIPLGLIRWLGILFLGLFLLALIQVIFFPKPEV